VTLAGCSTTQQEAARLQLNSARLRASQLSVRVTHDNPQLAVTRLAVLGSGRGSAIVVRLRSRTAHPVSDLPISVGVIRPGGRRHYLNTAPGMDYFQTHLPVIPADGALTWVLTTGQIPSGQRPFAIVGAQGAVQPGAIPTLPRLTVAATLTRPGRSLALTVGNPSAAPQYQLPVYAVASRAGRYVAAGEATIANLGTGTSTQLQVTLVGNPARATISLEAPPTIFR